MQHLVQMGHVVPGVGGRHQVDQGDMPVVLGDTQLAEQVGKRQDTRQAVGEDKHQTAEEGMLQAAEEGTLQAAEVGMHSHQCRLEEVLAVGCSLLGKQAGWWW